MRIASGIVVFVFFFVFLLVPSRSSNASECGLSCCLAGAVSGAHLADTFGLSLVIEHSAMETIRHGTDEVSPDRVIADNQQMGISYKVPTRMTMQRATLTGYLPITSRFSVVGALPYVINDMDMRSSSAMGMTMDMRMDTVQGLGDVSLLGLYVLHADAPVRPTTKLTAGFGVKAPTGKTGETGPSGNLVHAMMQTGSGSWDPLFLVNYMRAYYPLVLQANALYQLTTEGYNGYEFGDRLELDLSAKYNLAQSLNLGLGLTGIHTLKDKDHDGKYSAPDTSMVDNTDNTGLDSVSINALAQVKLPLSGAVAEVKYQHPLYQDVNGYQQVLDWRILTSLSWAF